MIPDKKGIKSAGHTIFENRSMSLAEGHRQVDLQIIRCRQIITKVRIIGAIFFNDLWKAAFFKPRQNLVPTVGGGESARSSADAKAQVKSWIPGKTNALQPAFAVCLFDFRYQALILLPRVCAGSPSLPMLTN